MEEVVQVFREGCRAYFGQFWNFIDILNLLLFAGLALLRLNVFQYTAKMLENSTTVVNISSPQLQRVISLMALEQYVFGFNAILMLLKLFKYVVLI